jgi:hypothetical protein
LLRTVRRLIPLLAAVPLAAALWPLAARAGEANCWFEAGVLVVPAEVAGVAGDYVLDTGAQQTLMAVDAAQGAGFADDRFEGPVRLAGLVIDHQQVAKAKLDARFWWLSTPVAGVIGADLLGGYVLDVRFAPCRIGLWRAGEAPGFKAEAALPLGWSQGRPVVQAAVSDDGRALQGRFVPATGSDTPVRLRDDLADAPGAAKREGLYPFGALRPRLRALSLAGDLYEQVPAGLVARAGFEADGEIGAPVLSRYRLRFDFPGGRLGLAHEKGPPDRSGGP